MNKTTIALVAALLLCTPAALGVEGYALYTRGSAFGSKGTLKLKQMGGGTSDIDSNVGSAQFSPDGTRIAYVRQNGGNSEIVLANRDGSGKNVLASGYNGSFAQYGRPPQLCWRLTDKVLFAHNREKYVYAVDVNTRNVTIFYTSPQSQAIWWMSISSDGNRMSFYSRTVKRGIWRATVSPAWEDWVNSDCGNWISPDGTKFTNNRGGHQSMYVRNWNESVYKSFGISSTGEYWNDQKWSNNSNKYILYPRGKSSQLTSYSNVWVREIDTNVETQISTGNNHDYPRDFWVGAVSTTPLISLSRTSVPFTAAEGGANPDSEDVTVSNSGGGTMSAVSATVSAGASWLTVTRSGSGNSQTLTNSVNISGLTQNSYSATVTVDGGGATNSKTYTVSLTVTGPPVLTTIQITPSNATVAPSGVQSFTAAPLDQNGDPISAAVSWSLSGGGTLSAASGSSTTFTSDGTENTFTLTASSGAISATATINVTTISLKINCGTANTVSGWEDQTPYIDGNSTNYTFSATMDTTGVTNAAPAEVYKTCRNNEPTYSFPSLGNGTYTVRLHFADQGDPGRRSMDVTIEGVLAIDDLDISGEAGISKALVKDVTVNVNDGNGMQIVLTDDGGIDSFVNGIEIFGGGGGGANVAPAVNAGADQTITVGDNATLAGTATDDGQPNGTLTTTWSKVSGPGNVLFIDANLLGTEATFSLEGTYVLELTATDSALTSTDQVTITVNPGVQWSITVISPNGGEAWTVGSTHQIRWSFVGTTNVAIRYSTDGGASWKDIHPSIDDTMTGWLDLSWTVPDDPSTNVILRISDYIDSSLYDESDAPFEIVSAGTPDTTPPTISLSALEIFGSVNDPTVTQVTVGSFPATVSGGGMFTGEVAIGAGGVTIQVIAADAAGNTTTRTLTVAP